MKQEIFFYFFFFMLLLSIKINEQKHGEKITNLKKKKRTNKRFSISPYNSYSLLIGKNKFHCD